MDGERHPTAHSRHIDPALTAEAGGQLEPSNCAGASTATPRPAWTFPRTQEAVLGALDGLGLPLDAQAGTTLGSRRSSRAIGPGPPRSCGPTWTPYEMPEDTGLDFASGVDGKMHACGHDAPRRHAGQAQPGCWLARRARRCEAGWC